MKKNTQLLGGILGLTLLLVAFWQVRAAPGLQIIYTRAGKLPMEIVAPAGANDGSRPLVLVGHGLAGSGVIMRGFAYTLAKAGYVVALWDFDGHGGNSQPLPEEMLGSDLVSNAEQALAELQRLGIADASRLAIIGHSMGSGVAMIYGQKYPETMATIAVSPVGIHVTPELPHNLLVMAGSREPAFLRNAQQRLAEAGGAGGDPAMGTGRKLVVIPGVEHITIVFSPITHKAARDWLNATFGVQPGAVDYTDRRILWYCLGVIGAMLVSLFLVPPTSASTRSNPRPLWLRLTALLGGVVGATLLVWLMGKSGLDLTRSFGVMVGGFLMLWFAAAGLIAMIGLSVPRSWRWLGWPGGKIILSGILVGAVLWVGIGLLGGQVWLPWLLIPPRMVLWPLGALCLLPWFLVVGQASSPANSFGRLGWWLTDSLMIIGGLLLVMKLVPGLFFLQLIMPVFPLILGAHALSAGRQRHTWAFGLSAALFISWVLLAVFPLS
jgi:dienelactone hydrolase